MSAFQRFKHLVPDSEAWRLYPGKTLTKLFMGLSGCFDDAQTFIDDVYLDLFPATTRQISEWEHQFGIQPNPLEAVRRAALAAEWAAQGGQSPGYIQGVLQTAGFDVYVHDWWSSGPNPYVARNPLDYTLFPLIGTVQCGEPLALCGEPLAECNNVLVNDPLYLVNKDLTERAPPPIPNDPTKWPFFLYVGGETFGELAPIPLSRKAEFHRLLLKLRPTQLWVVTLVDYLEDS